MLECNLRAPHALADETDGDALAAVRPGGAQRLVARRLVNGERRAWQPDGASPGVEPRVEHVPDLRVDDPRAADLVASGFLVELAQAPRLLVADGEHLTPPARHAVLGMQEPGDRAVPECAAILAVDDGEPLIPPATGLRSDGRGGDRGLPALFPRRHDSSLRSRGATGYRRRYRTAKLHRSAGFCHGSVTSLAASNSSR